MTDLCPKINSQSQSALIFVEGEAYWRHFAGHQTPEEFYQDMTSDLPSGTRLNIEIGPNGKLTYLKYDYECQEKNFRFSRGFFEDAGRKIVYHADDDVSPGLWKRGIGNKVHAHLIPLYRKLGLDEIQITATNVNTYAAARLGFVPNPSDWIEVRRNIALRLDFMKNCLPGVGGILFRKAAARVHAGIKEPFSTGLWKVVDIKDHYKGVPLGAILTIGKDFLPPDLQKAITAGEDGNCFTMRSMWSGHFDLRRQEFNRRVNAYLGLKSGQNGPALPKFGVLR